MNGQLIQGGKARLTENGPRQPFIVNGPGMVPAGVETDELTDFSDLLPTFCELAGAPLPRETQLDGKSIARLLLGEDQNGPRDWILAMGFGAATLDERGVRGVLDYAPRVIRGKRYKIHVHDGKPRELYDLLRDPSEEKNLVKSEVHEHREALRRLSNVAEALPRRDTRPRYEPLPPQPWDVTVEQVRRR